MKRPSYDASREEVLKYYHYLKKKRKEYSDILIEKLRETQKNISKSEDAKWEFEHHDSESYNAFWACENFIECTNLAEYIKWLESECTKLTNDIYNKKFKNVEKMNIF